MMARFSIRITRAEWSYIYELKSAEYPSDCALDDTTNARDRVRNSLHRR